MTLLTAAPLRAVYKVFSCLESVIIQGMISGDLLNVILKKDFYDANVYHRSPLMLYFLFQDKNVIQSSRLQKMCRLLHKYHCIMRERRKVCHSEEVHAQIHKIIFT